MLSVEADITDPSTPALIAREALERFGRVDTLVNNAGIYIGKSFTDTPKRIISP
jgi:NAD(P)-dependent dehydrogenase (short-subunit alcohol dehydrogenase family)